MASVAAKKFPAKAQLKKLAHKQINGITVASVEDFHSPISSLSLVLPAGITRPYYINGNDKM